MNNINFDKDSIKNELMGIASGLLTSSISLVIGVVGIVVNLFISIVFSIYLLTGKENCKYNVLKF